MAILPKTFINQPTPTPISTSPFGTGQVYKQPTTPTTPTTPTKNPNYKNGLLRNIMRKKAAIN